MAGKPSFAANKEPGEAKAGVKEGMDRAPEHGGKGLYKGAKKHEGRHSSRKSSRK